MKQEFLKEKINELPFIIECKGKKFYLNVMLKSRGISISYRLKYGLQWINVLQMLKFDDTDTYERMLKIGAEFKNDYIISEPLVRDENELEQVVNSIKFTLNKYKKHIKISTDV